MEKLKFLLVSVIILSLIGLIGYWAFASIQTGTEHATSQKIKELQKENEDLKKEVENLTNELKALQPKEEPKAEEVNPEPTQPVTYKYQDLIDEFQKLIDANIFMKLGSNGARVGTLQRFLNLYNNTSKKVDNDYGAGTKQAVAAFQKDQGLTADGEAGSNTFKKIIEWLKKQN